MPERGFATGSVHRCTKAIVALQLDQKLVASITLLSSVCFSWLLPESGRNKFHIYSVIFQHKEYEQKALQVMQVQQRGLLWKRGQKTVSSFAGTAYKRIMKKDYFYFIILYFLRGRCDTTLINCNKNNSKNYLVLILITLCIYKY